VPTAANLALPFPYEPGFKYRIGLTLSGGIECKFAPGATNGLGDARLDYFCADGSLLFGGLVRRGSDLLVAKLSKTDAQTWQDCRHAPPKAGTQTFRPAPTPGPDPCDQAAISRLVAASIAELSSSCFVTGFKPPEAC
jgi:hypothetical protein